MTATPGARIEYFKDQRDKWKRRAEAAEVLANKLPKTADGIPVVPGMTTWCAESRPMPHVWELRSRHGEYYGAHSTDEPQYSTRAAAEAAQETP